MRILVHGFQDLPGLEADSLESGATQVRLVGVVCEAYNEPAGGGGVISSEQRGCLSSPSSIRSPVRSVESGECRNKVHVTCILNTAS